MLPVDGKPLMERALERLRDAGIKQVDVAVHHMSEKTVDHFGNGKEFGVDLTYVSEEELLGTAGALSWIEPPTETILVVNGDILTQVDYRLMLAYHREQMADLTMAVQQHDFDISYGVAGCEGPSVRCLTEKNRQSTFWLTPECIYWNSMFFLTSLDASGTT